MTKDWMAGSAGSRGAPLRQLEREIGQPGPVRRGFGDEQRLHEGDCFALILGRFHVRFRIRLLRCHTIQYINVLQI